MKEFMLFFLSGVILFNLILMNFKQSELFCYQLSEKYFLTFFKTDFL